MRARERPEALAGPIRECPESRAPLRGNPYAQRRRVCEGRERVCRPDSVRRRAGATVIRLGDRLPGRSSHPPARSGGPPSASRGLARVPIRCCSGWGLACRPCRHVRGELLPHLFTLAVGAGEPAPLGRCAFCSTFRRLGPCGLLRLAVSQHPALWSPDLPPATALARRGQRSPDPLHCAFYAAAGPATSAVNAIAFPA